MFRVSSVFFFIERRACSRSEARTELITAPGYARHVDNLIWCKSIVKDLNNKSITREAQAQNREVPCESSVDLPRREATTPQPAQRRITTDELMYKNVMGGANGGRVSPGLRSPSGQTRSVNGAVVSGSEVCRQNRPVCWAGPRVSTYPGRPPLVACQSFNLLTNRQAVSPVMAR